LTSALWDDHPPDTAESALRVHLSALRKVVGANRLTRDPAGYALDLSGVRSDVNELADCESLVRNTGDRHAAERGLALWSGQSLANVRRLPGGESVSIGLDNRRRALTTAWRSLVLRDGDGATIVADLVAELGDDPVDEQRWAHLAQAQYQSIGSNSALQTIQRARVELVERAGLEPGPLLRKIEQQILDHDPAIAGRRTDRAAAAVRKSGLPVSLQWRRPAPFMGREDELDLLLNCWRETIDSSAVSMVVVRGQGGMGKTSLAAEAASRIADEGRVAHVELAEHSAPLAVLSQLRRHLPPAAAADVDPFLRATPDAHGNVEPIVTRCELIRAGVDLMVALGSAPTAIIIDGLEWVDDVTAEVLDALADGRARSAALLVIGLERDEDRSRLHAGAIIRVALGPLGTDPIARWISAIGSDRVAADVAAEAGGIPLFVALALEQRGDWERRLRSVSARARATAVVAALLGSRSGFEVVRAALAADTLQLLEDVDSLQLAGLFVRSAASDDIVAAHDLVRTSILDSVSPDRLRHVAALVIARVDATLLGPHATLELCRRAGPLADVDVLVGATASVAQALLAAFDFAAAKHVIERTLDSITTPHRRWPLLAAAARASLALGDHDDAARTLAELREAVAAGAPIDIEAHLLHLELNLGTGAIPKPDVVERLRVVIPPIAATAPALARRLRRRLVLELLNTGSLDEAVAVLTSMERDNESEDNEADLVPLQYFVAVTTADRPRAAAVLARASRLRSANLGPRGRTSLSTFFAGRAVERGDADALAPLRDEIAENAAAAGEVHARWWSEALGFAEPFWNTELDRATAASDQAVEFGRARLVRTAPEVWAAQRALIAWADGSLPSLLPTIGGDDIPVSWRALRALALAMTGDPAGATRDLRHVEHLLADGHGGLLASTAAAFGVEAASVLGSTYAVPVSRRVLEQHVGARCGFGGLVDLGPVDRYLALCEAADAPTAANARWQHLIDDPSTTAVWRIRTEIDAGRPRTPATAWGWMA
jgi:DNA-binding SARP family transcriptional activator